MNLKVNKKALLERELRHAPKGLYLLKSIAGAISQLKRTRQYGEVQSMDYFFKLASPQEETHIISDTANPVRSYD